MRVELRSLFMTSGEGDSVVTPIAWRISVVLAHVYILRVRVASTACLLITLNGGEKFDLLIIVLSYIKWE